HAALTADAAPLPEAETVFDRVLAGTATDAERRAFAANMLMVMARMSAEDGLVMQLHVGSLRDHHRPTFERFGRDKGADMPIAGGWTRQLAPLLNELGAHERFRLVLYTLDETTYSRELAPLAGFYPALRLGAPWWFFDSVLGMERYLDAVAETAGIYNLAGFVDDTRAYPSIPARHDVWRRVTCDWLAGRVVRGLIDEDQAPDLAHALAYDLTKETYRLGAAG
ncbi:MAG TPA: glucuronate isomerase, partial [Trueperaceae bacterium]|nr:glucuronate isomerase [Trueperaceae bacterium]